MTKSFFCGKICQRWLNVVFVVQMLFQVEKCVFACSSYLPPIEKHPKTHFQRSILLFVFYHLVRNHNPLDFIVSLTAFYASVMSINTYSSILSNYILSFMAILSSSMQFDETKVIIVYEESFLIQFIFIIAINRWFQWTSSIELAMNLKQKRLKAKHYYSFPNIHSLIKDHDYIQWS